ncbi:hypothetical protein [Streptomyces sp. MZ04]|uniref:hypothetical protein n=1 Tax=Streptomyces sp. MZ04 TaxID=2559236 RepID=UPI00107E692F|nr:hypothetical protein [Streptomyces sp. MZ04]TGB02555.1 hypothetical protein E2651_26810 [Streptomyces sp. MZ04]
MAINSAPLNILAFPQRWRPQTQPASLTLALLVLPKGNPLTAFQGTATAFADAHLSFDAVIVPTLDALPTPAATNERRALTTARPTRKRVLFDALGDNFEIRPATAPDDDKTPAGVKKFLPLSYRDATHYSESDSGYFVTDTSYECALKAATTPAPGEPDAGLEWEEILALVLRQPRLARELGLIHEATLEFPTGNPFAQGGYLFADLAAGSAYRAEVDNDSSLLARFAARIPPLANTTDRPVFASVLFPVTGVGTFDDVFVEADAYDSGFARAVHGSQARRSAQIEHELEPPPGALPPVKDTGIRLGWDDEQVTIWLNRQFDVNVYGPGPSPDSPLGVAGYRVDVRREDAGPDAAWHSLVAVRGDLVLDGIDLGVFDDELAVETVPVNSTLNAAEAFWLPSYFAAWTGGSIVLPDPDAFRITGDHKLGTDAVYHSVGAGTPLLRYGHTYQFRVRLMDLTGGGPTAGDPHDDSAGPAPTAQVPFRRFVPPGPVRVAPEGGLLEDGKSAVYQIRRPLLGYPDVVYTGLPNAMDLLLADAPAAEAAHREAALPDPDVTHLRIDVLVRTTVGDPAADSDMGLPYEPLYSVHREFAPAADQPLTLRAVFEDVARVDTLKDRILGALDPLCLPTARDVRLVLTPVGSVDPTLAHWGSQEARVGSAPVGLKLRTPSEDERLLLRLPADGRDIQAIFLQPDPPSGGPALEAQLAAAGRRRHDAPSDLVDRLAHQLGLVRSGLMLSASRGRRLVLGVANELCHTLNPDRSSVTFGAKDDLALRWLVCVRLSLERDWTWDALAPIAFSVRRAGEVVGELVLPGTVNRDAMSEPDRERTEILFLDAYDPKTGGGTPHETRLTYTLTPKFRTGEEPKHRDPDRVWQLTLPITTPPAQVPRLRSAGFAASNYVRDLARYTSTEERRRRLFVELDRPPDDENDRYFARVLAHGPDPMLLDGYDRALPEPAEPPLDVHEPIRVITPSSSKDCAGLTLMQELIPSDDPADMPPEEGRRYLLPLPEGLDADAPELFGFFVYELRVGHDCTRWSTAQGRFGLPLRVAGVQHPPPQLRCAVSRTERAVSVSAPHAVPVNQGTDLRPFPPRTRISALLYAQVLQADGQDWRNILLQTESAPEPDNSQYDRADRHFFQSVVTFPHHDIRGRLDALGLPADATLSVLAVEVLPERASARDPLGEGLGGTRILRTSPLTPVPAICTPERRL